MSLRDDFGADGISDLNSFPSNIFDPLETLKQQDSQIKELSTGNQKLLSEKAGLESRLKELEVQLEAEETKRAIAEHESNETRFQLQAQVKRSDEFYEELREKTQRNKELESRLEVEESRANELEVLLNNTRCQLQDEKFQVIELQKLMTSIMENCKTEADVIVAQQEKRNAEFKEVKEEIRNKDTQIETLQHHVKLLTDAIVAGQAPLPSFPLVPTIFPASRQPQLVLNHSLVPQPFQLGLFAEQAQQSLRPSSSSSSSSSSASAFSKPKTN